MKNSAHRISKPNFLLVAGDGRNVGKTHLACKIIEHLSTLTAVVGVKVSPHFHSSETNNILFKTEDFIIAEEKEITQKDSSLMLQAGAKRVFFVMAKPEIIAEAFLELDKHLPKGPVICESGGLHEIVEPGAFIFVKKKDSEIQKRQHLKYAPEIVENDGTFFSFQPEKIDFQNNQIVLK